MKTVATSRPEFRCAVIVSRKVDRRATARNRIKRLISESVRLLLPEITGTADAVFTVRGPVPDTQAETGAVVTGLFRQAGFLKQP